MGGLTGGRTGYLKSGFCNLRSSSLYSSISALFGMLYTLPVKGPTTVPNASPGGPSGLLVPPSSSSSSNKPPASANAPAPSPSFVPVLMSSNIEKMPFFFSPGIRAVPPGIPPPSVLTTLVEVGPKPSTLLVTPLLV